MQLVKQAYLALVGSGSLESDPVQIRLAERLDLLAGELGDRRLAAKSSSLGWLFGRKGKPQQLRGLYIWGGVGRGKSMMMDLFHSSLDVARKKRIHFHDFMADAHDRIAAQRLAYKEGRSREEDPMPAVARSLAAEADVLCFDEFSVTDIADAMILGRLFAGLFEAGTVVVATSNVAPDDLYRDGLNRQLFMPFIGLLKSRCEVFELDAGLDYRLARMAMAPIYSAPLGPKAQHAMEAAWELARGSQKEEPASIRVKGREIAIPRAAGKAARFEFADLCERPLGAQDYLALARKFHTILIENVPVMGLAQRNAARRFINLIDTLYDNRTRLVISAAATPHALYLADRGVETFEFARTASRLTEMQSREYLENTQAGVLSQQG